MNHLDLVSAFKQLAPTDQVRVLNSIGAERSKPERFLVTFRYQVTGPKNDHGYYTQKDKYETMILDRSPVEFMASLDLRCKWFGDAISGTLCVINVHPFHGREHIPEGKFA